MVKQDQAIPADLLILSSNFDQGTCYIETKNLDGETNLKIKRTDINLQQSFNNIEKLSKNFEDGLVTCETPNNLIYKFEGKIKIKK